MNEPTQSETPRTDKATVMLVDKPYSSIKKRFVPYEEARQLERELNEANKIIARLQDEIKRPNLGF